MILQVFWRLPVSPPRSGTALSFLYPADEEVLASDWSGTIHRGREVAQQVRPAARRIYHELIANLGVAKLKSGLTLRQMMSREGEASSWWFHRVAFRDAEGAEHFNLIVQALVIRHIAASAGTSQVQLHGAPPELAAVLAFFLKVVDQSTINNPTGHFTLWIRGIGSRLAYLLNMVRIKVALSRHYQAPAGHFAMIISSFWDWGFKLDRDSGRYLDRYFPKLPDLLAERGVQFGYFAWFDPHYEPAQKGRKLRDVLVPLASQGKVVLLQSLLGAGDVLRALLDFSAYRAVNQLLTLPVEQAVFVADGIDWRPLFESDLRRGALNAHIANYQLVAVATARAAVRHQPQITLGFLEHFPYARAHYEGMRRSGLNVRNYAMQHAGCARDKTFYYLHPRLEFGGEPDGSCVPRPDHVFVMGMLGADRFRECGYREEQISVTGSARYDHVVAMPHDQAKPRDGGRVAGRLCVLVACSLEVSSEIAMVEAACLAAAGLEGVQLRLRNHPSSRVDNHPRFSRCRGLIEASTNALAVDIAWADIILYSYSTVAEEAFLLGKTIWQWLPVGFNGSALAEAVPVPQFGSVGQLRRAMLEHAKNPDATHPSEDMRLAAAEMLFKPADRGATRRIADACTSFLAINKHEIAALNRIAQTNAD